MSSYGRRVSEQTLTPGGSRIAVVEDDGEIRALIVARLLREGYEAIACEHGAALYRELEAGPIDLVVLDLMMPGEDGLAVCRRVCANGGPPVIILSARGDDLDRIIGLEVGADDYIAKPFNPRELLARIRAILRRHQAARGGNGENSSENSGETYRFAGWMLNIDDRSLVQPGGAAVVLSAGEFALLAAFVRHPRRILTRDQLLDWTRGDGSAQVDRAIDVQLSRLRRKLGDDPRNPALIKTVRGDGYLFAADVRRDA